MRSTYYYVFDLDGTLILTKRANKEAYLSIGVTPPKDFNKIPWQKWTDPETHKKKNEALPDFLRKYARATLLYEYFLQCAQKTRVGILDCQTIILSNVSHKAFKAVVECFPELSKYASNTFIGHSPEAKVGFLRLLGEEPQFYGGIYFDDSLGTVDQVATNTKFGTCLVNEESCSE